MPAQLTNPTVIITRAGANGQPVTATINNPLYQYQFTNAAFRQLYFSDAHFRNSVFTRRQPPTQAMTSSNMGAANTAMNSGYSSRRAATYGLFTIPSFNEFSNTALSISGTPNGWNSLESIHNTIHVNLGGQYGHMTAVAYSAVCCVFPLEIRLLMRA